MDGLLKLRIILTLAAIIGIGPVTWGFFWFSLLLVVALFQTFAHAYIFTVFVASTVGLWGCWKAYAGAMARHPAPRRDWRVVSAVIIALVWGVVWTGMWGWNPYVLIAFLMPGITGVAMLLVAAKRARREQLAEASSR